MPDKFYKSVPAVVDEERAIDIIYLSKVFDTVWHNVFVFKFNKAMCKVLPQSQAIPNTNTGWAEDGLRAALRIRICVLTALKVNHILGCTKRSVTSRSKDVIMSLYCALEY